MKSNTKILCIETSTDICSVCLSVDDKVLGPKEFKGFKHSSHLLPTILELLQEYSIRMEELDAVALSKGPGSYTGLRVGASTSKGIAYSLDIPLIAINTLKGLASHAVSSIESDYDIIMPMLDARRDEVYTAQYNIKLRTIRETKPLILNDLFEKIIDPDKSYLICGNGAQKAQQFCSSMKNIISLPLECSAKGLCSISQESYLNNDFVSLDHFEPFYLKPPNITIPKSIL